VYSKVSLSEVVLFSEDVCNDEACNISMPDFPVQIGVDARLAPVALQDAVVRELWRLGCEAEQLVRQLGARRSYFSRF